MSITYEDALSTLTAMFGPPWTQDYLDAVLRHFDGHMENTVDSVLSHGDSDPQILVDRLRGSQQTGADSTDADEALAREIAREEETNQRLRSHLSTTSPPAMRRVPGVGGDHGILSDTDEQDGRRTKGVTATTHLPPDFLRIPGYNQNRGSSDAVDTDEALARMLQDQLSADELRNNPEFAHLSNTVGRTSVHQGRRNVVGLHSSRDRGETEGNGIMDALSGTRM